MRRSLLLLSLSTLHCGVTVEGSPWSADAARADAGMAPAPSVDAGVSTRAAVQSVRWLHLPAVTEVPERDVSVRDVQSGLALEAVASPETSVVRFTFESRDLLELRSPFLWCGSRAGAPAPCLPSLLPVGRHTVFVAAQDDEGRWSETTDFTFDVRPSSLGAPVPSLFFVHRQSRTRTPVISPGPWPSPPADYSLMLEGTATASARFQVAARGYTKNENLAPFFMGGDSPDGAVLELPASVLAPGSFTLTVTRFTGPQQTGIAVGCEAMLEVR
jgi:hypothetical protein